MYTRAVRVVDLETCDGVGFHVGADTDLAFLLFKPVSFLSRHISGNAKISTAALLTRHHPILFTNYAPKDASLRSSSSLGSPSSRAFRALKWCEPGSGYQCCPFYAELRADRPGFFEFRVVCSCECPSEELLNGSGVVLSRFFLHVDDVAPALTLSSLPAITPPLLAPRSSSATQRSSSNGCPLAGMSVQTLIVKCLGILSSWPQHFRTAAACGYTAVHFTPIQPRGSSDSSYCICDQLGIEPRLFEVPTSAEERFQEVEKMLTKAREEYNLVPLVDVLLSHTAENTLWLSDHPDAGFSLNSAPHLKKAFVLDTALKQFTHNIKSGVHGSIDIKVPADIDNLIALFVSHYLPKIRLWEFYVLNARLEVENFSKLHSLNHFCHPPSSHSIGEKTLQEIQGLIVQHPGNGRFMRHISNVEEAIKICLSVEEYEEVLSKLNLAFYQEYDSDIKEAMNNLRNRLAYDHFDPNGPHHSNFPVIPRYFKLMSPTSPFDVNLVGDLSGVIALAHHGWVMNDDPAVDFAGPHRKCYLHRQVNVWEDTIKLRYGDFNPHDSQPPWLWDHMAKYVTEMAQLFSGFRIDNCHSVPLEVLRFLIARARSVRPDLIILAELFSTSPEAFQAYTGSIGIHGILKEGTHYQLPTAMSHLLFESGGALLGPMGQPQENFGPNPAKPYPVKGWVFDLTHDNPPVYPSTNCLALAAAVCMSNSVTGSTRGFDELFPFHVNVVTEKRLYAMYDWDLSSTEWPGITLAKTYFNVLHNQLAISGFSEMYSSHVGPLVSLVRHNPLSLESVHMITYPSVGGIADQLPTVEVLGEIFEVLFVGTLTAVHSSQSFFTSSSTMYGCKCDFTFDTNVKLPVNSYMTLTSIPGSYSCTLSLRNFPPGSAICFKSRPPPNTAVALSKLGALLKECDTPATLFSGLDLTSMNSLLFHCKEEEEAETTFGPYEIPDYGKLTFCGIQGWMSVISSITTKFPMDMGHPLLENLRKGDWPLDYTTNRLNKYRDLHAVASWSEGVMDTIKLLPRFLIPKFFCLAISALYRAAIDYTISQMSSFVRKSPSFVQSLALSSVQVLSCLQSTPLVSPKILPALSRAPSLAAGLPHFSVGYMRNWGRDTFISVPGLMLVTGRFNEARDILLTYASSVRHGLVPNLLDSGVKPRYNSRDATWWFLSSLMDYCEMAPAGYEIFQQPITRLFPHGPSALRCTLADVIQEILTSHANGIHFREIGAGPDIDKTMQDEGFIVDIHLDSSTGFIFGGNQHNCGTWMDKMGESHRAKNFGIPATPRDGAAIEIIALLYKTVSKLAQFHKVGKYPSAGVVIGHEENLSFASWSSLIFANFHRHFYIPLAPSNDKDFVIDKTLVHRRGIYKDTLKSSIKWADYQLRPNMAVAMSVAPDLFRAHQPECEHALEVVSSLLVGPLGMRTLDPADWAYRPNYTMDDTEDFHTSKGFNYHQGPEWLWPFGHFLKALVLHKRYASLSEMKSHILTLLGPHIKCISESPWSSLPELTNLNGSTCHSGCPAQAWSCACMLEALYAMYSAS
ncbi:glycoside hydrolase family 13 protein [Pelomyxa schiedti]|nr:glycoside hydrolase family 13 protein [Pelomyxa schiedti]